MTTTDLTVPGPVQPVAPGTVSLIQQTAMELQAAHQIAQAICGTQFVPTHFRGKPDECAVAILYGATIGFDPVTAVQQIFVIGGKPALYARAMVAIVLSRGHEIWTEEEGPGRVVVAGKRKGSDKVQRVEWTTDLAQQAGYTSNAKYRTDPRSMLYARASGDVARRIAPDALMGMAYNVEELELGAVQVGPVQAERSGTGRLRAAIGPGPALSPEERAERAEQAPPSTGSAEDVHDAETVDDEPQVDGITAAQLKKMGALMREAGLTGRNDALAFVAETIGREVATRNDLTKSEAGQVIDALEPLVQSTEPEPPAVDPAAVDAAWGLAEDGDPR